MLLKAVIAVALLWCAGARCSPRQRHQPSATFSEQVAQLLDRIRMPEKDLAAVPRVLHDLELVLSTEWPGCQVLPFGSTVTGLSLVGSDIDAYVLLPDREEKSQRPSKEFIIFKAKSVLHRSPDYVIQSREIHSRYYFLRIQHPSHTKIDLHFNDIEGGRNSALLGYLIHLDDRALQLALIVKYWWAQIQKLAGYKMIPSYGMSCMVVFYLQQVGVLPPVTLLQQHAKPIFYRSWNTGFDEIDYKSSNNESLYQLLGGFFEYYNEFNYDEFIISPFIGHPVQRKLFTSLRSVPAEFENDDRYVGGHIENPIDLSDAVLVQDVFVHNKNLAVLIETREGSPFTTEFERAARAFRKNNQNTFLQQILTVPIPSSDTPERAGGSPGRQVPAASV